MRRDATKQGAAAPVRNVKAPGIALAVVLVVVVLYNYGCGTPFGTQLFDKVKWNEGRQNHPSMNVSPWMLGDLMANHLSLGMTMDAVTNLLGPPEIATPLGTGLNIRGEFIEQTVYVYHSGMHNGWLIEGTNSLVLYFGRRGEYLREWSPSFPVVRPVNAADSAAAQDAKTNGTLHIGNMLFAGTPGQFHVLLGPPDEQRTEHQLDYFLGKRSRFAWDEVFVELHFDHSKRLTRMSWSEH